MASKVSTIKTPDGNSYDIDAKTLEGQNGAYYLNYNNLTNKPTIPTGNVEFCAGTTVTPPATGSKSAKGVIFDDTYFTIDTTSQTYPFFSLKNASTSSNGLMSSTDKTKLDSIDVDDIKKRGVYYIEGTSTTAGTWTGTCDDITAYYDGLTVAYRTNIAGGSSTTTLNINGLGAKTCYLRATTKVTTHYGVNTVVMFTYITVSGTGRWVTSDYDANSYAYLRQYFETANSELPLVMSHTTATSGDDSYKTAYGGVVAGVTLNPSTKTISATAFKENGTLLADKYATKSSVDNKADVYTISGLKFNGLSSVNQTFPNNTDNKTIIGIIDNGNTGIISTNADSWNTRIYYSDNITALNLTTLLFEDGAVNNVGFSFGGSTIVWNESNLSNTYYDSATIIALKNAFVKDTSGGTLVDCEYNYKNKADKSDVENKADVYKLDSRQPLEVGMDMGGKKLIINTESEMETHFNPPIPSVFVNFSSGSQIYTSTSSPFGIIFVDMINQQNVVLNSDFSKNGWNYTEYTLPQGVGTITSIASSTGGSVYTSVNDTFTTGDNAVVDCEYNYKEIQALKAGSGGGSVCLHTLEIDAGYPYFINLDVYTSSATQITSSQALYAILGTKQHSATYNGSDGYGAISFQMNNAGTFSAIGMIYSSGAYMYVGYVNISNATIYNITDTVKQV